MKAIILARVSTEEQMKEGQSIPAQLEKARDYAKRKGFEIYKEFCFDESSIKDRRDKFEEVIKEIKKSKEKVVLIVECIDRLQRSFKESIIFDELRREDKIEIHFIREGLVIKKDSSGIDIQRWDMGVLLAKSYILQLSDNVKRSFEYKIKNGEWIAKPPIGYVTVEDKNGTKQVILDPETAPIIKRLFELYSSGNYSIAQITEKTKEMGLKTGRNLHRPLHTSEVYHILKNPFYYGYMRYKGNLYPHKYPVLISKFLFDKCQEVMERYHRKPFKYNAKPFIFRGFIRCADCGCAITPEIQRGHVYYSCTNTKKMHKRRKYVREEKLLEPVYKVLENLKLTDKQVEEIVKGLKNVHEAKNEFQKQQLEKLRKDYDRIGQRISNVYDFLTDGVIDKEIFYEKLEEYKKQQREIDGKMRQYTNADEKFYITAGMVLDLARRAKELFECSEIDEKRQILNFLLQNAELKGRNLRFSLNPPFDTIVKLNNHPISLRR